MSTFQTSDGLNIHYEDDGNGLPILCLPGLTRNTRDFDFVAPHLRGARLIRMDYRGRGQSDWGAGPQEYTLPVEGRDIMELLAHLGLAQVAVLGTSRGGLHAMGIAAVAPEVLLGVALNDVGPEIDMSGMGRIVTYLGQNPASKTHEEHAELMEQVMRGFANVPDGRWLQDARNSYRLGDDGLEITYDPALREATAAAVAAGLPDLWPFFDALSEHPLALIWGQNSDLLSADTVDKMIAKRPDMLVARVPDRAHVPFLDEAESLAVLHQWVETMR